MILSWDPLGPAIHSCNNSDTCCLFAHNVKWITKTSKRAKDGLLSLSVIKCHGEVSSSHRGMRPHCKVPPVFPMATTAGSLTSPDHKPFCIGYFVHHSTKSPHPFLRSPLLQRLAKATRESLWFASSPQISLIWVYCLSYPPPGYNRTVVRCPVVLIIADQGMPSLIAYRLFFSFLPVEENHPSQIPSFSVYIFSKRKFTSICSQLPDSSHGHLR